MINRTFCKMFDLLIPYFNLHVDEHHSFCHSEAHRKKLEDVSVLYPEYFRQQTRYMNPTMPYTNIPQCTIFNLNVLMCAHSCYRIVYCGIFVKYIVGFVGCLYCVSPVEFGSLFCTVIYYLFYSSVGDFFADHLTPSSLGMRREISI